MTNFNIKSKNTSVAYFEMQATFISNETSLRREASKNKIPATA